MVTPCESKESTSAPIPTVGCSVILLLACWTATLYCVAVLPTYLGAHLGLSDYFRFIGMIEVLATSTILAPPLLCVICFVIACASDSPRARNVRKAAKYFACGIVPVLFVMLPMIARRRIPIRPPTCEANLKQMGLVCKIYALESCGEILPVLSPEPGQLMMRRDSVHPEYLSHTYILVCPEYDTSFRWLETDPQDPAEWFGDQSYFYLGYLVTNDDEMRAFADAYRERIAEGLPFDEDLPAPTGHGSRGGDSLLRLRDRARGFPREQEQVEEAEAAAIQDAKTVIMIERLGNHETPGGHVLFLDGHVEFRAYPGEWPMTKATMAILDELDALGPAHPTGE